LRCGVACGALAAVLSIGGVPGAMGGHSLGHYPSYYPDEIRIESIDPASAAKGLEDGTLHAYIGPPPDFTGPVPGHVKPLRSLGSFVVLSFSEASLSFSSSDERCTVARAIMAELRDEKAAGFAFHPYPVTPYHADYVHHLDRVEAAMSAIGPVSGVSRSLRIRARGPVAEAIVRMRWQPGGDDANIVLEEVPLTQLTADAGASLDGAMGPPWVKEGWFQAHRLLSSAIAAAPPRAADETDESYGRLMRGEIRDLAEQVNLERHLVSSLSRNCERFVAGYMVAEEYANEVDPPGVENVAYDAQSGLNAPIFIRTVKLKDYPWNGSLRVGVNGQVASAWNPVGGFSDAGGRLIWSAVGDPAMVAFPFNASWIPNRIRFEVTAARGQSGGLAVPAEAVRPEPGTGMLKRVGIRTFASAKVVYEVLASPFLDGTEMEVTDLIYPFAFAYRWGSRTSAAERAHDPGLETELANLVDRLVGFRVLRVDRIVDTIAPGLDVARNMPVFEVYLRNVPGDEHQIAALAPPWSTVPWHLSALMEEAVLRGYAAFSKEEAERLQTAWMDLVRDPSLRAKLQDLTAEFERDGYRPDVLKDMVTAEDARRRWRALRIFAETNGHFLVTNGPYRLKQWTPVSVTLQAVREATYPLGFGTFDRYVNPPRAVIRGVTRNADQIVVQADAELTLKVERHYRTERQPLTRETSHGLFGLLVVSRYLLIGADGTVLVAEKMHWEDDGRFVIDLPKGLLPGPYTVVLAIFLDGNSLHLPATLLRFHAGERSPPG
jgi:hypothetical protein